jgi:hypothetical protein
MRPVPAGEVLNEEFWNPELTHVRRSVIVDRPKPRGRLPRRPLVPIYSRNHHERVGFSGNLSSAKRISLIRLSRVTAEGRVSREARIPECPE